MASVTSRGKTELRCLNCANSHRACFWVEPENGIRKCDEAAEIYKITRQPANTRKGRAEKMAASSAVMQRRGDGGEATQRDLKDEGTETEEEDDDWDVLLALLI